MVLLVIVGIAAALSALELQRALRLAGKRKLRQQADPNRLALLIWAQLEQYWTILRQPAPEELLEIAQLAKYSLHTVSQEQLGCLAQAERSCIEKLKKRNFLKRLWTRWILALY